MKFFLLLFIHKIIRSQKCDRKILESYGVVSLLSPSKEKIVFCPDIKASCCPSYEQFKLQKIYNKHLKPHFIQRSDLIKRELKLLKETIVPLFVPNGELEKQIQNIESIALKRQAIDLMSQLKVHKFDFLIDKAQEYQQKAFDYVQQLKSTFLCTVCDFDSQKFIKFDQNSIIFNEESCDELVGHTLMYSNILNRGIVTFLQNLSSLLSKINIKNKPITVPGIGSVISSIKECSNEFKETEKDLTSCKNYCSNFKLNSDLPAFEGYPEFFLNILVQLKMNFAPQKGNRILQALKNIESEDSEKIIHKNNELKYQRKKQRYKKMIGILQNLYGSRVLEENQQFIDELNPELENENELIQDPFDEELSVKQFDELMMSQMLKIQNQLYDGEPQDLRKIIKTYIAESYNPEIEDIEDENIFRIASVEQAHLEKLQSRFFAGGINLKTTIHTMNWSLQFHDIVLSLAGKHHSVGNDKMDLNLLIFMNKARNENVNDFHSDNFIEFKETNEFAKLDYKKSRLESANLKIIKENEKYNKAHQLLRDYGLENVDAIVTELQQKRSEIGPIDEKINQDTVKEKLDDANVQIHELIKKEEEKNEQEKEFQENKKFLIQVLKEKGLKGVIQELRNQNEDISKQHQIQDVSQSEPQTETVPTNEPSNDSQTQATSQQPTQEQNPPTQQPTQEQNPSSQQPTQEQNTQNQQPTI